MRNSNNCSYAHKKYINDILNLSNLSLLSIRQTEKCGHGTNGTLANDLVFSPHYQFAIPIAEDSLYPDYRCVTPLLIFKFSYARLDQNNCTKCFIFWLGYPNNKFSSNFGCKIRESFSMFFF